VYELELDKKGSLRFRTEASSVGSKKAGKWNTTIVNTADVERFYEFVSTMGSEKKLGDKPLTVGYDGEEKSYSNCKYCPLNNVCNSRATKKQQYEQWLTSVQELVINK
jgi:hypothetical protein